MRVLPWWTIASATLAPALLIGGWTIAAHRQPPGYDPATDTISALAGYGATDRWVMTLALAGLGLCHLMTALGLRTAAPAGRVVLAVGGLATVLVAAFPLPRDGGSVPHAVAAAVAFAALAVWPALAARWNLTAARENPTAALRPPAALAATAVLLLLVGWFAVELSGAGRTGLAERVAAGAEAVCPLLVAARARTAAHRARDVV